VAPFFLKRGVMPPFLRSSNPLLEKRGEERGEVYEKGGTIPTEKYRYRLYLIPGNTDTKKMTGITMVSNSKKNMPVTTHNNQPVLSLHMTRR